MAKYLNVIPYPGKVYPRYQAALADWDNGASFLIQGFSATNPPWPVPVNKAQAQAEGFTLIRIHWQRGAQPLSVTP